ncbi:MAG: acyltransferase [Congregibacter sp.]
MQAGPAHSNHFNLIRLVAASMVFVGHCFPIALGEGATLSRLEIHLASLAGLGVDIFFAVSGFLVTQSLLRASSLGGFAWRRMVRIYPGLLVAVVFCVAIIGAVFTRLSLPAYATADETVSFAIGKASLLGLFFTGGGSALPGVFTDAPFPNAVNASLWTLPWEAMMYTLLAVLGFLCRSTVHFRAQLVAAVVAVFLCFFLFTLCIELDALSLKQAAAWLSLWSPMSRFGTLFFAGACISLAPGGLRLPTLLSVLLAVYVAYCYVTGDGFYPVYLCARALLVIKLGCSASARPLLAFNKLGDYSYGIYIFAFPLQQAVVELTGTNSPLVLGVITLPFLCLAALFSWHCIEQPCLRAKGVIDGTRWAVFPIPKAARREK